MNDIGFLFAMGFFWLFAVIMLIAVVSGKIRKKQTTGFKGWLKVYWSEIVFIAIILLSILFVLKGAHIILNLWLSQFKQLTHFIPTNI